MHLLKKVFFLPAVEFSIITKAMKKVLLLTFVEIKPGTGSLQTKILIQQRLRATFFALVNRFFFCKFQIVSVVAIGSS